jgi:hypothetical protein
MSKKIDYFIENYNEELRHRDPLRIIQKLRIRELISRYLMDKPQVILDVGGAYGVYSLPWQIKVIESPSLTLLPPY